MAGADFDFGGDVDFGDLGVCRGDRFMLRSIEARRPLARLHVAAITWPQSRTRAHAIKSTCTLSIKDGDDGGRSLSSDTSRVNLCRVAKPWGQPAPEAG